MHGHSSEGLRKRTEEQRGERKEATETKQNKTQEQEETQDRGAAAEKTEELRRVESQIKTQKPNRRREMNRGEKPN